MKSDVFDCLYLQQAACPPATEGERACNMRICLQWWLQRVRCRGRRQAWPHGCATPTTTEAAHAAAGARRRAVRCGWHIGAAECAADAPAHVVLRQAAKGSCLRVGRGGAHAVSGTAEARVLVAQRDELPLELDEIGEDRAAVVGGDDLWGGRRARCRELSTQLLNLGLQLLNLGLRGHVGEGAGVDEYGQTKRRTGRASADRGAEFSGSELSRARRWRARRRRL